VNYKCCLFKIFSTEYDRKNMAGGMNPMSQAGGMMGAGNQGK
jgi:hypothetical protein